MRGLKSRHCEPKVKQSRKRMAGLDCFVAPLLAMTENYSLTPKIFDSRSGSSRNAADAPS
jgi:hypothetical protein